MYKINTANGDIHRLSDGFIITAPYDEPEYLDYAAWIQEGNSPVEFYEEPLPPVPESVSRFQARAALFQAGLLETVEMMMKMDSTPMLAKLAWQDAQEFARDSSTVIMMGQALGLTSEQVDNLFRDAVKIKA